MIVLYELDDDTGGGLARGRRPHEYNTGSRPLNGLACRTPDLPVAMRPR